MRAVWIDPGSDPDTTKLHAHYITRAYFQTMVKGESAWEENPRLTARYLYGLNDVGGWQKAVGEVGIIDAPEWGGLSAIDLARRLDATLARLTADARQCAVHVNAEAHDFDLVGFLHEWRQLRAHRVTGWVIEGLQGGRLTSVQVDAINHDPNLTVWAEAYTGGMTPIDADTVRANLIDAGIARQRALVVYDAARLSPYWDGCAFTQGRLPSV